MPEIRDKYQEPLDGNPSAFSEEVKFEKKDIPERASINNESVSKEQEILKLERELAEKKQELSQEVVPEKIEKEKSQPTPEKASSDAEALADKSAGEAEIIQETKKVEPIKEKEVIKEETAPVASKLSSKVSAQIKKLKELDRESQIKELCNLSFSEDIDFAVNVAKGLDNAYVLDEFHDALVDELYDKLIEKGELKKM